MPRRAEGITTAVRIPAPIPLHRSPMMTLILLAIVVLIAIGVLPTWPYSTSWGYGPSSVLALIVVIFFVWLLLGYGGGLHFR
jgi:hypothetical protein